MKIIYTGNRGNIIKQQKITYLHTSTKFNKLKFAIILSTQ